LTYVLQIFSSLVPIISTFHSLIIFSNIKIRQICDNFLLDFYIAFAI